MRWPKRFLCVLLVLLMSFTLLPATVFAGGPGDPVVPGIGSSSGTNVGSGSGEDMFSGYYHQAGGYYVSVESTGVTMPKYDPKEGVTFPAGWTETLVSRLCSPPNNHFTVGAPSHSGFFLNPVNGKANSSTSKFQSQLKTAWTDTLKYADISDYKKYPSTNTSTDRSSVAELYRQLEIIASEFYEIIKSYAPGGVTDISRVEEFVNEAETYLRTKNLDWLYQWQMTLLFPMNDDYGVIGTSSSGPSSSKMKQYMKAPGEFISYFVNSYELPGSNWTDAINAEDPAIIPMLRYSLVMAMLSDMADSTYGVATMRQVFRELYKFMCAEEYTLYVISIQIYSGAYAHNGSKDSIMLGQDFLHSAYKNANKSIDLTAYAGVQAYYKALNPSSAPCGNGIMWHLFGSWKRYGQNSQWNDAVYGSSPTFYPAAMYMLGVDVTSLGAMLGGLGIPSETGSKDAGSTTDPWIKVWGSTYYPGRGFGYIGLPTYLVRTTPPTVPGVGGEYDVETGNASIALGVGVYFTDNETIVTEEPSFVTKKNVGVRVSLTSTAYVDEDGRPHEDGAALSLWDTVKRAILYLNEGQATAREQYKAFYDAAIAAGEARGVASAVSGQLTNPASLPVSQYSYNDGDITIDIAVKIVGKVEAPVNPDSASRMKSESRGYYQNGVKPAYTYEKQSSMYDPKVGTEQLVRASSSVFFCEPLVAAFNAKYSSAGIVAELHPTTSGYIRLRIKNIVDFYNYFSVMDDNQKILDFDAPYEFIGSVSVDPEETIMYFCAIGSWVTWNGSPVPQTQKFTINIGATDDLPEFSARTAFTTGVRKAWGINTIIPQDFKWDFFAVTGSNPIEPQYHSSVDPAPHAEINQGTVVGNGQIGKFDSMLGTPTFTETRRDELAGSGYYGSDGHYYQYFAVGGTEFIIEFDARIRNQEVNSIGYSTKATRKFTFHFTGPGECDQNTIDYECPGGHQHCKGYDENGNHKGDNPPCDDSCVHGPHCSDHPHIIEGGVFSFTIDYTGLCYVEIVNLRLWQLTNGKLINTSSLLGNDVDSVTANIQPSATGASWNIAGFNNETSNAGRMVYDYEPDQNDEVHYYLTIGSNACGTDGDQMEELVTPILDAITNLGAWCVSDFVLMHTTTGIECVLYYEYHDENTGDDQLSYTLASSPAAPAVGGSTGSLTITPNGGTEEQEFPFRSADDLWLANPWTSEVGGFIPEGVTYGGYNGNYSSPSTKYTSKNMGNISNMTGGEWANTQAYKNESKRFGNCMRGTPSSSLRIMNDRIVIPDRMLNGVYPYTDEGFPAYVFYRGLVDYKISTGEGDIHHAATGYPMESQSLFGGASGHVLAAGYGSGKYPNVANSVVVYNPIGIQAVIESLPKERDQRTQPHVLMSAATDYTCPGDDTCAFQKEICTRTDHLHKESCYAVTTVTVHSENNVHQHVDVAYTDEFGDYHPACSSVGSDTGANNQSTSGNSYISDNGTVVYSFTAGDTGGVVTFYSHCFDNDPVGEVYVNGTLVASNDDIDWPDDPNFYVTASYGPHTYVQLVIRGYSYGGNVHWYAYGINTRTTSHEYTCNNLPLNEHVCNPSSGGYTWTHTGCGHAAAGTQCNTTSSSKCTVHNCSVGSATQNVSIQCYTSASVSFVCTDPHHTWDTSWKVYTVGHLHKDGQVCSGYNCTNTTDIQFVGNQYHSIADIRANGHIVRHANGKVHLTVGSGTKCTECWATYVQDLFPVTDGHRTNIPADEWEHYRVGDPRCWSACFDDDNHNTYSDSILTTGGTVTQGDFINLDYQFTVYYPNTGNMAGTGRSGVGAASNERGKGYSSPMDTTEWIKKKWVIFPFDVVYNGTSYPAYEKIYLFVPQTVFQFYCVLENSEMADAEIVYGATAINDPSPDIVDDALRNETQNTRSMVKYRPMGYGHDVDRRTYIDVVGRIGALTIEDVGDFRYSNFFKQTLEGWLVPNVIRRVDNRLQRNLVIDEIDIRGEKANMAYFAEGGTALLLGSSYKQMLNTYGYRTEREGNLWTFPLVPYMLYLAQQNEATKASPYESSQEALATQPMRVGYNAYMDFETLGNYYGMTYERMDGEYSTGEMMSTWNTVIPHYFRLDLDTGTIKPVDVYMKQGASYVIINDADKGLTYVENVTPDDMVVSLDWVNTKDRRNYDATEDGYTQLVYNQFKVGIPHGSQWNYGTYDWLTLSGRNRTSIGTRYTYGVDTDPSDLFETNRYYLQGARWHFSLGLPSSSVFVYAGKTPTQDNIDDCSSGNAVIIVGLEIYADGEVWSLLYDGKHVNKAFQILKNGPTYNPNSWTNFHYPKDPGGDPSDTPNTRDEMLILVQIISINHSSKEDVNQSGTH